MRLVSKGLALGATVACAVAASVAVPAESAAERVTGHAFDARGTEQLAQVITGGSISDIRVDGTQRIEPATVRSYLVVKPGDPFDTEQLDESLKALFATGLFGDVSLRREGSVLRVVVTENPIINRIAFEGNRKLDDEQLQKEVQLRPRVVYTRTRVQSDVQRILDLYRRNGRFAASVEPKIIPLDQNRVDLVFEVNEGPRTGVNRITFIGNKEYGDAKLRGEIQTKESRWYRFLSTDDNYDPDRLTYDREMLRRFYLKHGYADFRVVSAVAELSPEQDGFYITFTLEEGERYSFGTIGVESHLHGLNADDVKTAVVTREKDWYNAEEVEDTINKLTSAVNDLHFPFVDIRPRIERKPETRTIDIVYEIHEGPRVFVERIDIGGNVRTLDKVIRREFQIVEGDPYNGAKLKRSEQRVRDLGYFEKVNVSATEGSAPDQTVVQVEVAEQSTGEIMLGAGFSTTDGPLADFGIRERNLFGRGQDLRFSTILSKRRREFDISFTEPYFMERDLSAGVDLFRITRNNQDQSSFDESNTGFSLRLGFPITDKLRQRVSYTLEQIKIENIPLAASRLVREQAGSRLTSSIGQEMLYDARDSRLNPTDGYYIRFNTELAGLGGDARYLRNRLGAGYYYSLGEQWILNVAGEVGHIAGLGQKISIADRFFLGGDTLRGFAVAGVGPRDLSAGAPHKDSLGGSRYYRGTAEMSFPLGLPDELGLSGHAFSDFGSLWGADVTAQPGEVLVDDNKIRVSAGVGLGWRSPLGPIRVDFALPLVKQSYDQKQQFRFSFGTRF